MATKLGFEIFEREFKQHLYGLTIQNPRSQAQVLLGTPEKQTLTRNGGGFVF